MYKKVYDESTGVYIYVDNLTGEQVGKGIFDVFSSIGKKVFENVGKKTLENVGKAALEAGTKKVGTEVGNLAADKITSTFKKKKQEVKKPVQKPVGDLIVKELTRPSEDFDINLRINKLLSGSGRRRLKKYKYNI